MRRKVLIFVKTRLKIHSKPAAELLAPALILNGKAPHLAVTSAHHSALHRQPRTLDGCGMDCPVTDKFARKF